MARVSMTIDEEYYEMLEALARKDSRSLSSMAEVMVKRSIDKAIADGEIEDVRLKNQRESESTENTIVVEFLREICDPNRTPEPKTIAKVAKALGLSSTEPLTRLIGKHPNGNGKSHVTQ